MYACRSSLNRSWKVRYLDEKGADCRAKDCVRLQLFAAYSISNITTFFIQKGKTALFRAAKPSKCEDDVTDVLQYLVIEKGIDINSADEVAFLPNFALLFGNSILEGMYTLFANMS